MSRQGSGGVDGERPADGQDTVGQNKSEKEVKQADAKKDAPPERSERNVTNPDESMAPKPGAEVRGHVGERLRAYYQGVEQEPVPDRFLNLLAQLEAESDETDPEK